MIGACGARSGLSDLEIERDAGLADAGTPVVGDDAGPRDSAVPPRRCDEASLPELASIRTERVAIFHQGDALATLRSSAEVLFFAGGEESGYPSGRMGFLDLDVGGERPLAVELVDDASVLLPLGDGAAVYDARRDRVVVVAGTNVVGPTDRVFAVTGDLVAGGSVRARYLPPFPEGPSTGVVAAIDPEGDRMIVLGGESGATWALELATETWREVADRTASPRGQVLSAGLDPRDRRIVAIFTSAGATTVFALDLASGEWIDLGSIAVTPSLRGELLFDPEACGFHLVTDSVGCRREHSFLLVERDSARTVSTDRFVVDAFGGSALFSGASNRLWMFGGRQCDDPPRGQAWLAAIEFDR